MENSFHWSLRENRGSVIGTTPGLSIECPGIANPGGCRCLKQPHTNCAPHRHLRDDVRHRRRSRRPVMTATAPANGRHPMRMSSVQLRPSFAHHTDHACINDARHRSTEAGRQQTKEEDVATQKKRNAKETRGDDAAWYRLHGSSMPAGGEEMRFDSARGLRPSRWGEKCYGSRIAGARHPACRNVSILRIRAVP